MTQHDIQSTLQQLGDYVEDIKRIFESTSQETLSYKESSDKWSPKEILGHLIDVELVFHYRLKKIIEEDKPALANFNQNIWVEEQQYNHWDTAILVNSLLALRRNLVFWLGRIREDQWEREGMHSKRGLITFRSIVELLISHLKHHYLQIKERIKR